MVVVKPSLIKQSISALQVKAAAEEGSSGEGVCSDILASSSKDRTVLLSFNLKTVPVKPCLSPIAIPLPHPIYEEHSICVIVKDPVAPWKEAFRAAAIPAVKKVISIQKLKKFRDDVVWKQQLCKSFGLFVCDVKIGHLMRSLLGSHFVSKAKLPAEVRLSLKNVKTPTESALGSTFLRIGSGNQIGIRLGQLGMENEKLVENAKCVLQFVSRFFAKDGRYHNAVLRVDITASHMPQLCIFISDVMKRPFLVVENAKKDEGDSETVPEDDPSKDKRAESGGTKKRRKKTVVVSQ